MKYTLAILLLLPLLSSAQQNMVPNGNFESYSQCPNTTTQLIRCNGWRQYTNGTSDFFHTCGSPVVGVPSNWIGFQNAANGNGYAGGAQYVRNSTSIKEYIARSITPLIPGQRYEVSISVSLSNNSKYGGNDLGVFFYDSGPTTINQVGVLSVTPQIDYSSYGAIMDTTNWVRLTKEFVADSAYDNIVIGGFKNNSSITLDSFSTSTTPYAYYYFDSIVVKPTQGFQLTHVDSQLCLSDTFTLQYITSQKYNSSNVFTAYLSDNMGSFSNPINIGSKTSDTSGSIFCTIPNTLFSGSNYKIRIIATNHADTASSDITLQITNRDSIATASSNSPLCEKTNINFTGITSETGVTWQWSGPNGFNSTVQNPTLFNGVPLNSGDYFVAATLNGCSFKDTLSVLVKPLPVNLDVIGDTVCTSDTIQLAAPTTSTGVSFAWTGPNGFSSTSQSPTLPNATTSLIGVYHLIATLNGCSSNDSTHVLVHPNPTPVTLSLDDTCSGDTMKLFSTNSNTGASYTWSGVNSFTANTQNAAINNASSTATGWYKMTVGLNNCTYVDSIYATIHPIPQAPAINYNAPLCEGQKLVLVANAISGASYSWAGPNGFNNTGQTAIKPYTQFTDAGTYRATATVNSCTSPEATINVSVKTSPFVAITAIPSDTICVGDMAQFNATPNNHGGSSPSYQWYINTIPAGTSSLYSSNLVKDGDTVYCVMTEYTQCSDAYQDTSTDIIMTVLPWEKPTVTISSSSDTIKPGGFVAFGAANTFGGNTPGYQWRLNGKIIGGAISPVWSANTLADMDEICVEMTSSYQCPNPKVVYSNCINVIVRNPADVNNLNKNSSYTLYPNPNNGQFIIKAKALSNEPVSIKVVNTIGAVLYNEMVTPKAGILQTGVNLNSLAAGVYFVRAQSKSGIKVIPFTIK